MIYQKQLGSASINKGKINVTHDEHLKEKRTAMKKKKKKAVQGLMSTSYLPYQREGAKI